MSKMRDAGEQNSEEYKRMSGEKERFISIGVRLQSAMENEVKTNQDVAQSRKDIIDVRYDKQLALQQRSVDKGNRGGKK